MYHIIPLQVGPDQFDVVLVLEQDSLDRIRNYDPAELAIEKLPEPWNKMRLRLVLITFATTEEREALELASSKGMHELAPVIKQLMRGWKFRPEKGDHDDPYAIQS